MPQEQLQEQQEIQPLHEQQQIHTRPRTQIHIYGHLQRHMYVDASVYTHTHTHTHTRLNVQ